MTLKTKKLIGNILYAIAVVLLLIGLYQKGASTENRFIEIGQWVALLIAAIYGIGLANQQKKESTDNS